MSERCDVGFISCIPVLNVEWWWLQQLQGMRRTAPHPRHECCLPCWQLRMCVRRTGQLSAHWWARGQCWWISFLLSHPRQHWRTTRSLKHQTVEFQILYGPCMQIGVFCVKRRQLFWQTAHLNVLHQPQGQKACQIDGAARPAADSPSLTGYELNVVLRLWGSQLQPNVG